MMDVLPEIARVLIALGVTGLIGWCALLWYGEHCAGSRTRRARMTWERLRECRRETREV